MSIKTRAFFKALFAPRYIVKADDLDNLCDSVTFKNEDIASASSLGLVKVGLGLVISEGGVLSTGTASSKIYRALISQTGILNPEAIILENGLEDLIAWSVVQNEEGVIAIKGTLEGVFLENKVFGFFLGAVIERLSDNEIQIPTNGNFSNIPIEIIIYN